MTIGLISFEFPPEMATGGIGTYMAHLAKAVALRGHEVHVFSGTPHADKALSVKREFLTNHLVHAKNHEEFRARVVPVFDHVLHTCKIDLIESPEVGACGIGIKREYPDMPMIVKLHTPGVLVTRINNTYLSRWIKIRYVLGAIRRGRIDWGYWAKHDRNCHHDPEYQICKMADRITSPSEALHSWARKFWKIKEEVVVVPNPFFREAEYSPGIIRHKEKIVVFVGKISLLKGIIPLIRSIPEILHKRPDYRFILVGREEPGYIQGHSLKSVIERELSDYSDKVEFTGAVDPSEVQSILRKAAICIFPSLWENYPNVVLEAMSAGCAVVASDRGGIPEIIVHGENGLLINPMRYREIVKQTVHLMDDNVLRKDLAGQAMMDVSGYKYDDAVDRTIKVYESVLKP